MPDCSTLTANRDPHIHHTHTNTHIKDAVEIKHGHREAKLVSNKRTRINLLKNMLKYDEVDVFITRDAWNSYKARAVATLSVEKLDSFLLEHIRLQLNCLRCVLNDDAGSNHNPNHNHP